MRKKIIAVDFDGVLHSFTSGWTASHIIPDPPVKGALAWFMSLFFSHNYYPIIFSCRAESWRGRRAIRKWLTKHGIRKTFVKRIKLTCRKPAAHFLLDDRVMLFTGKFPGLDEIDSFKPWHGQGIWGDNE